jgi:orotate phosphoribosyltransferase
VTAMPFVATDSAAGIRLLELLQTRAYEKRQVVLSSGKESDFYIDCRRVVLTAEGHFLVGNVLSQAIWSITPSAVAVGGLSLGADPLASATATISHIAATKAVTDDSTRAIDAFYVRKEPKGHGTGQFLEGAAHLPKGAEVVIVEDVITTGRSCMLAVERAVEYGLKPIHIFALVDRCEGGREIIERELPLTALFQRGDFL